MTSSVEIKPELEDRLLARAQSPGQPLELFIQRLLETEAEAQDASAAPVLTGLEKAAAFEARAKSFPPNLPNLTLKSIRRENNYRQGGPRASFRLEIEWRRDSRSSYFCPGLFRFAKTDVTNG